MAKQTDNELVAEFVTTFVRFATSQQQHTTSAMIATSALVQAVIERFPELAGSYEKYRVEAETSSPLAHSSRQAIAELEAYLQRFLDGLKETSEQKNS